MHNIATVDNMTAMNVEHHNRINDFVQRISRQYYVSMSDGAAAVGTVAGSLVIKCKEEVEQGVTLGDALDRLEE